MPGVPRIIEYNVHSGFVSWERYCGDLFEITNPAILMTITHNSTYVHTMDEQKKEGFMGHPEGCRCYMCQSHGAMCCGGHHHRGRFVVKLLLVVLIFWAGSEYGEMKAFRHSGYRHSPAMMGSYESGEGGSWGGVNMMFSTSASSTLPVRQ